MDYKTAEEKIKEIISKNKDSSVLQSVVDFLYEEFDNYSWVGVYLVKGNELILGPWRGEQATEHVRIPIGKGVCGSAAMSGKTEVVPDVNADKRYLSCFVSTKSEIVVPIKKGKKVFGEIDIDSDKKNAFTKKDEVFLERVARLLLREIEL